MAILGFLAHVTAEAAPTVEDALAAVPELTTYGIHKDCYVVAVADAPSTEMEALINYVKTIDGVLAVYVTSYTTEDEEEEPSSP